MSFQSSSNKLSLRQFVKNTQQQQCHIDRPSAQGDNMSIVNKSSQQKQGLKPSSNDRRYSLKQGRKMKLSTLPCEQIGRQKQQSRQQFMFRSTWQGDMQGLKQEMKLKECTSPTFATQCMSLGYNTKESAGLFHAVSGGLEDEQHHNGQTQMRRSINNSKQLSDSKSLSRSRSKYKNKSSSIQKFIGDSVAKMCRNNSIMAIKNAQHDHHLQTQQYSQVNNNINDSTLIIDSSEKMVYEMQKMQAKSQELIRQKRKLQEKYKKIKEVNERLEEELLLAQNKVSGPQLSSSLMTNEQLLQKMRLESFWKFYLRAQKMIKSSLQNNPTSNPPQSTSTNNTHMVINFMKQLQALREVSSQMKKQHKVVKKLSQERLQQIQQCKDKLSVQEASIQQQRLRCVAYEGTIKKLREELVSSKKQLIKLQQTKQLQQKLTNKTAQCTTLTKQLSLITQQLQQQKIINSQCQRQRLSIKKKTHQLTQQINSLNKQLSSLKTSYNLLQIQKQQLSVNKKQLIEKQKLKQRVYQLEKELKTVGMNREMEISKLRGDYDRVYTKEIEVKESKCKEMDQRVGKLIEECKELDEKNEKLQGENQLLETKLKLLEQENNNQKHQIQTVNKQFITIKQQHHNKLSELQQNLSALNKQLQQQSLSLLGQQKMIKQLRQDIGEKQRMLRQIQNKSQKMREQMMSGDENNKNKEDQIDRMRQLQEYVSKLQCKHNQALEMYETVHNEKVEIEMQLQCCQQEMERCEQEMQRLQQTSQQLEEELRQYRHQVGEQDSSEHRLNNKAVKTQQIIGVIQSILSVKQQIIRKILIFCPFEFRELFVEYIYCGDVIKERYLKVIEEDVIGSENGNNNNDGNCEEYCYGEDEQREEEMSDEQQDQQQHSQYVQQQRVYYQRHPNHITTPGHSNPNSMRTLPNNIYKPNYQQPHSRQYSYQHQKRESQQEIPQPVNQLHNDNQISILMQEFMRIGSIIQEETSNGGNVGGYNSQYVSSGKRQVQIVTGVMNNHSNYVQSYNNTNNKVKSNVNNNPGFSKTQNNQMLQQQQQAPRSQQSFLRETNLKQQTTTKQPLISYSQQNTFNNNNTNNNRPNMKITKQNNINQQNYLLVSKKNNGICDNSNKFQSNYCIGKGEVRSNKQKNVAKYPQQQQQYSNSYHEPQYTISRPLFSQGKQAVSKMSGNSSNNNRNNFNNGVKSEK